MNSAAKDELIDATSSSFSGFMLSKIEGIYNYFGLASANEKLVQENARLKQENAQFKQNLNQQGLNPVKGSFKYTPARVINNSILKFNNYITLNKGYAQGIRANMAVTNADGVVGIVLKTSDNYAIVMSLLNSKSKISARLKGKKEFGSIVWDGQDFTQLELRNIPSHIEVNPGDTVETNTFSAIFPEGEMIGTVVEATKSPGDNFLTIRLNSSVNFSELDYVYVLHNSLSSERLKLESHGTKN